MDGRKSFFVVLFLAGLIMPAAIGLRAQEAAPAVQVVPLVPAAPQQQKDAPQQPYRSIYLQGVEPAERDLQGASYLERSGPTPIPMKGTTLAPSAKGEAKVTSERGGIAIEAKFDGLPPPGSFGKEYLTYVFWALSKDGRPSNLGEVVPAAAKNGMTVTTALRSFGLFVTAEPYFSVRQPSDVVVLENQIPDERPNGIVEKINVHYMLLPRGIYAVEKGSKVVLSPIGKNDKTPTEFFQANNAVRVAQAAGAQKYAPEILDQAVQSLKKASDIDASKKPDRTVEITFARLAVERAEDARVVALRKQAAEQ